MSSTASITLLRDHAPQPSGLVWEEPPAKNHRPGRYAAIAAALSERPDQWAVIRTYPTEESKRAWGYASAIGGGKFVDFRPSAAGRFEAAARTIEGQVRVYARYVAHDIQDSGEQS